MHKPLTIGTIACGALLVASATTPLRGAATLAPFTNEHSLEGDAAGDTAGPFYDPTTGASGTLTTLAVAPSGKINVNLNYLAVNAQGNGDSSGSFDPGEGWTFAWDVDSRFSRIDFGNYDAPEENFAFSVSSPALVGLAITPGTTDVTFHSATGTFAFSVARESGRFISADLYGSGVPPTIPAGIAITLAYNPASGTAILEDMAFTLIPEPSAATLATIAAGLLLVRRRGASSSAR